MADETHAPLVGERRFFRMTPELLARLARRVYYGGRKGRRAIRRLRADGYIAIRTHYGASVTLAAHAVGA